MAHNSLHLNEGDILTTRGDVTSMRPGVTLLGVSNASESQENVIYENNEAKTVGTISIKAPTPSSYH